MSFATTIKRIRLEKKMNKTQFAKLLGVSDAMIHHWEKGTNEPRMGRIQEISEILNVPLSELLDFENEIQSIELSTEETDLDYFGKVSAGNFENVSIDEGTLKVPSSIFKSYKPEECIGLQVNGDSMNKVLANGSYIVVVDYRRTANYTLNTNDILVLRVGNEYTVKRVRKTETKIHLDPVSFSDEFKTNTFDIDSEDTIEVVGKVIYNYQIFD